MKKTSVRIGFLLAAAISCQTSCFLGASKLSVFMYSTDLEQKKPIVLKSNESSGTWIDGRYFTTPTSFDGYLYSLYFCYYDTATLQNTSITWELRSDNGESVFFDLSEPSEISQGNGREPDAIGFGSYNFVLLNYLYCDIGFQFEGQEYEIRIFISNREGSAIGEMLMKDLDGSFGWISESGDPNVLLDTRPDDPIMNRAIGWPEYGPLRGQPDSCWGVTAVIPDEYLFDVPSFTATYDVWLDFNLQKTVVLDYIDPEDFTKRDILESLIFRSWAEGYEEYYTHEYEDPPLIVKPNVSISSVETISE